MATTMSQAVNDLSAMRTQPEGLKSARMGTQPFSFMAWLERRSQPYIVGTMAAVAILRGFYLFTDKLVNLAHFPALNAVLSLVTGILLSGASELTITIAGRRHKLFKTQLFNAKLALASATGMRLRGFHSNSSSSTASRTEAMGAAKVADIPAAAPATRSVLRSALVR